MDNLIRAWRKARKGKTKKEYVVIFERDTIGNLFKLQKELIEMTYEPKPLKIFIIRDPKTRKIAKSAFRDRIIHHALVRVIEPIFEKIFIYDSCANRVGKGTLFALKRFDKFKRKVSSNGIIIKNKFNNKNYVSGFCFKADIKHYFREVNHEILIRLIKKKINDKKVILLISKILKNYPKSNLNNNPLNVNCSPIKGMPLGNLTSQFFANIYLNELDYFVKHKLKAEYYLRYVDDFILLHKSKKELKIWKNKINIFLRDKLYLELHKDKSKIIPLSKGIDFLGFRNFYHFRLLRKRNVKKILSKINNYNCGLISQNQLVESFQGWYAYSRWANSYKLTNKIIKNIVYIS